MKEKNNFEANTIQAETPKLLKDVKEISEDRGQFIGRRDVIKNIVEFPLVKAVEELYDKNIRTTETTANRGDIANRKKAVIVIDFDTLSEENKEIANKICKVGANKVDEYNYAEISFPVDDSTTVQEIEDRMLTATQQFKIQPLLWAQSRTEAEIRKFFNIPAEENIDPQDYADHYYYDQESKLFYPSEEICRKVKGFKEK